MWRSVAGGYITCLTIRGYPRAPRARYRRARRDGLSRPHPSRRGARRVRGGEDLRAREHRVPPRIPSDRRLRGGGLLFVRRRHPTSDHYGVPILGARPRCGDRTAGAVRPRCGSSLLSGFAAPAVPRSRGDSARDLMTTLRRHPGLERSPRTCLAARRRTCRLASPTCRRLERCVSRREHGSAAVIASRTGRRAAVSRYLSSSQGRELRPVRAGASAPTRRTG